jgi:protein TonB
MYADRSQPRRFNPASLGAALALNGALIGALLLAAPEILHESPDDVLITHNIPIEHPAPEHAKPQPKRNTPNHTIVAPDPVIPFDGPVTGIETTTRIDQPPSFGEGTDLGGGGGVTVDPEPIAPVLVDAAPDPKFARDFQPPYPASELRTQTEGKVTVRVLIGVDGRIKAIEQVRADSSGFFDATRRQALAKWRFRPATRDGIPVEAWRVMTVRFQLET